MWMTFAKGMGTGAGLIIAIGAQNAFVLSQGVRKNHYLLIALICAVCDALLVVVGVTGMGRLIAAHPALSMAAGIGGALFLFAYGTRAFYAALKGHYMDIDNQAAASVKTVVLTTLAVTLLNPHVYLDTVVLVGAIASQFPSPHHLAFGAGAVTASFIWFFTLSIGATFLAPLFRRQQAWRMLDLFVGVIMWVIGASIAKQVIGSAALP